MNRETKIGLITGVTLIVLIGAMLSSYLSVPNHGADDAPGGQGSLLRQQLSNPVGIAQVPLPQSPQISHPQQVAVAPAPPQQLIPTAVPSAIKPAMQNNLITQLPYDGASAGAVTIRQTGPTINPAVTPVVLAIDSTARKNANRTEIQKVSTQTAMDPDPTAHSVTTRLATATRTFTYTVRPGDTLGKIARHFYHDSGPIALRRIINANHGKINSTHAIIRVGENITIPAASEQNSFFHSPLLSMDAETGGSGNAPSIHTPQPTSSRHADKHTYQVRSGDTLMNIARKTMGAGTKHNVHRIMILNHIHDARTIFAGQELKIP